jgi:hypothetical protein
MRRATCRAEALSQACPTASSKRLLKGDLLGNGGTFSTLIPHSGQFTRYSSITTVVVWAREIASQVTEPLLTCEAVLAETAFHLGSSSLVLAFVREGLVRPAFDLSSRNSPCSQLI